MSMTIGKESSGDKLTLALSGRLDTTTAPQLEAELNSSLDGVKELVFDMKDLEYISSAGLRVLLKAQKTMNKQGSMTIRNTSSEIMEIFEVTGFDEILSIEK
ncbi:MAG: STAS domain-containing protein [Synergistaceae bacterium]|nr:STAS domain-containing protein [Synergistaceae bacterium]